MSLATLLIGMGFGILCAATTLVAGFGLPLALLAYAVGGAAHVLLSVTLPRPLATH